MLCDRKLQSILWNSKLANLGIHWEYILMNNQPTTMKVYLASALSNAVLNQKIADCILSLGHDCYLPQNDLVNSAKPIDGQLIASTNRNKIEACDLLIAVYYGMGLDTSWEIGYSIGLGKVCFLVCPANKLDEARLSAMPFFSVSQIIVVPEWSSPAVMFTHEIGKAIKNHFIELVEKIPNKTNSADAKSRAAD